MSDIGAKCSISQHGLLGDLRCICTCVSKRIISYEFSRECGADDKPYYPIRLAKDNSLYEDYVTLAKREPNVSFVGRLGTYRYLDMDVAIGEAMQAARGTIAAIEGNAPIPAFFVDTNTPHSKT